LTPDRRQVWLLKDSKLEPARIRIGITDGTATEIADGGLKEGDRVIVNASAPGSGNLPPAMRRGL
jgi:multidrug efflux pump subunit AcrA (membrane-fusion protein)